MAGASGGRVTITLSRLGERGGWKRLRPRRMSLGTPQSFRLELVLQRPQMRVQAHYEGSASAGPSRSRALTVPGS